MRYMKYAMKAALALATGPAAVASAAPQDDSTFERVLPVQYQTMLRDAKRAYSDKRYDEAFGLFRRAACAGDKESQSAVGRMYLLGQGVARDDLTGYAWLKVAAEFIFPGYQKVVHRLEEAMTPEQRTIADAQAKRFVELYGRGATHMSCSEGRSRGGYIVDSIVCVPRQEGSTVLLKRCAADPAR